MVSRAYRNRRIGDFLKEIDLTEGKSTGFPIIRDAMAGNGNPEPVFHTDKDQVLFLVTLPCHSELPRTKSVSKFLVIIDFMTEAKSRAEILNHIGLTNHTKNFDAFIKPLLDFKIIELTIPNKPNSRLQKYRLTQKGAKLLK